MALGANQPFVDVNRKEGLHWETFRGLQRPAGPVCVRAPQGQVPIPLHVRPIVQMRI